MSTHETARLSPKLTSALKMLGDTWILAILCNLSRNKLRFNELYRAVSGINPATLTNRLKRLEKEGMIRREEETLDKISVVYELTDKGKAIAPIVHEFGKFADNFYKND